VRSQTISHLIQKATQKTASIQTCFVRRLASVLIIASFLHGGSGESVNCAILPSRVAQVLSCCRELPSCGRLPPVNQSFTSGLLATSRVTASANVRKPELNSSKLTVDCYGSYTAQPPPFSRVRLGGAAKADPTSVTLRMWTSAKNLAVDTHGLHARRFGD
jgi:hypothetical protein